MAISWPWNAPEHNRRRKMWTPLEAKTMDYYSFGMLCLWVLFEKDLSAPTPPFENAAFWEEYKIPCSQHEQSIEILHNFKVDQKLPLLAQWLLEADNNLYDNERDALKSLFNSILNEDQERRDISAGNLFKTYVLLFQSKIVF